MKYDIFIANYLREIYSGDRDILFEWLKLWCGGLSNCRTASLINMAASCMDPGERYVEVGVFNGYTMIAAGYNNGKDVVGIDCFDTVGLKSSVGCDIDPNILRDRIKKNCAAFPQVKAVVIDSDFRVVDLTDFKTGVSYIDGRHDYPSVIENLKWLEPSLAKDAILIFDDTDLEGVSEAIIDWCHDHKEYELLFMSRSRDMFHRNPTDDNTFLNGIAVVHYKGKNGL